MPIRPQNALRPLPLPGGKKPGDDLAAPTVAGAPAPTATPAPDAGRPDAFEAVSIRDPLPYLSDALLPSHHLEKERFDGPTFVEGADLRDVRQGMLGDCFIAASAAALAEMRPEEIENKLIREVGEGPERHWEVHFSDGHVEKVDGDLFVNRKGQPAYGKSNGPAAPHTMEMWWPILEKAFAQRMLGQFTLIGIGGPPDMVLRSICSRETSSGRRVPARTQTLLVPLSSANKLWETIQRCSAEKLPMVAGSCPVLTKGQQEKGLFSGHAYTVVGCEEENGERFVVLRNPWGFRKEGVPDDPEGGVFRVSMHDFRMAFMTVATVRSMD